MLRFLDARTLQAGWLHNNEPIAMLDFSLYVNFRISGAGQRLFGDGIAIWVTDSTATDFKRGGNFFAGPKDFRGFVVVLDTFKNAEVREGGARGGRAVCGGCVDARVHSLFFVGRRVTQQLTPCRCYCRFWCAPPPRACVRAHV